METVPNTSIQSSDYRDLPVEQLVESPTNPRKRYDEVSLQELAQSIRAQGVLAPLLVREVDGEHFEIVAGSRRFRAARLAGTTTVPVRVVHLGDADAIVTQVVENLQRENVHPLEEAHGFRALLDLRDRRFDVNTIAAKAGKNPHYIATRLKLTELIPPAAEAFLADELTLGHALLIAKLPSSQQAEALNATSKTSWTTDGQKEVLISVKELAGWIESNLLLDLQTAPFDRSDASLVPEAGSCHECTKRTGANSLLFPESDRDQCLDRQCYQAKIGAHVASAIRTSPQLIQISTAWGTHTNGVLGRGQYVEIVTKASRNGRGSMAGERKKCAYMTSAIIVEGSHCGHLVNVCAEASCEIHHAESRKDRETRERMRIEQRKQVEKRKEELATRIRVLGAILERVASPLPKADLELITTEFIKRLPQEYRTVLSARHSPATVKTRKSQPATEISLALKNLDEAGYSRLLMEVSLLDAALNVYTREGGAPLEATAKRYRVNVQKIADSVAAEFRARTKKKEERRKLAAKGGPRESKKAVRKRT